jgi:hypothetical protein
MTVVPTTPDQFDHSLRPVENSKVCNLAQSFPPELAIKPRAVGSEALDARASCRSAAGAGRRLQCLRLRRLGRLQWPPNGSRTTTDSSR